MPYPQPGELDHGCSQLRVSGFGDALFVRDGSAPAGRRRQSGICGNLPSVGKAAEQPPDHRTPASSEPIPFKFFNVAPGAAAVELNRRTHLHCLPRYAVTNSERANSDQPPRSTCLTTRPSDITYARSEFCSATATFCSTRIKLIPRPRKLATTDTICLHHFRSQPGRGFIHNQQIRLQQQSAADSDHLLLATAQKIHSRVETLLHERK